MYTYKSELIENSAGQFWYIELFLDGEHAGNGTVPVKGSSKEAIEAEAQRLEQIHKDDEVRRATLAQEKTENQTIIDALSAEIGVVKPVPAPKENEAAAEEQALEISK